MRGGGWQSLTLLRRSFNQAKPALYLAPPTVPASFRKQEERGNSMVGIKTRRAASAAAALAVVALAVSGGAHAATPRLIATVGPGISISLKTATGKPVTTLKRGTYAITVRDRSAMHDFRLRGPGINKVLSGVSAVGTKTVTVRLAAGRYQFYCQPHASAMHGAFRVT